LQLKLAVNERFRSNTNQIPAPVDKRASVFIGSPLLSPISGPSSEDLTIEKKGVLLKRGGKNYNKWQKRYFVLAYNPERKIYTLAYKLKEKVFIHFLFKSEL
jgi:hypothetical protein